MHRHEVSFVIDAPPARVWRLFHPKPPIGAPVPRTLEHPGGTITILNEGDEHGQGLVRTCTFRVPRYLLSGGTARSWELVAEVRPNEYARYQALGKPPWSTAEGWHSLEPLDDGRHGGADRADEGTSGDDRLVLEDRLAFRRAAEQCIQVHFHTASLQVFLRVEREALGQLGQDARPGVQQNDADLTGIDAVVVVGCAMDEVVHLRDELDA